MGQQRVRAEPVSRRRLLLRGGAMLSLMAALAGCTEDVGKELPANEHWPSADLVPDLPVRERTEILEAGIEAVSDSDIAGIEDFVTVLEAHGVEIESAAVIVELLRLEYVETAIEERGTLDVTASVAGAYAALVAGGFEGRGLELVLFEPHESTIGVVEIATSWAVEFNEGALSAAEYGELVASTIESTRTPPGHDVAPDG